MSALKPTFQKASDRMTYEFAEMPVPCHSDTKRSAVKESLLCLWS